jgi:PadR family transcriptional regulator, regulatory protein PadR
MSGREPLTPLSMAILLALLDAPQHGYTLMQAVAQQTGRRPGTGTLYTALDRLAAAGQIEERAAPAGEDARRRYFAITRAGVAAARAEAQRLQAVLDRARSHSLLPARRER